MKPTVGRIVHYVSAGSKDGTYPSECRAAIITELCDNPGGNDPETGTPCVSVAVFNPEGMHFNKHRPQDETEHKPMTWHWPEREPEEAAIVHVGAALDSRDLRVDVYRSGDLKTVKVLHLPSGESSTVTRRSALEAKAEALRLLTIKLVKDARVIGDRDVDSLVQQVAGGLRSIDEVREESQNNPWGDDDGGEDCSA